MRKVYVVQYVLALLWACCCAQTIDLVPVPTQELKWTGKVTIGSTQWSIVVSASADAMTQYAATRIQRAFENHGLAKPAIVNTDPGEHCIYVGTLADGPAALTPTIKTLLAKADSLQAQGYSLAFDPKTQRIFILGNESLGALYGATTLEQLVQGSGVDAYFLSATIRDWPHFKYRVEGALAGLSHKVNYQAFVDAFTDYLHHYLIPNRINVIDTRLGGGFKYQNHSVRGNTPQNRMRLQWAAAEAHKYGIDIEFDLEPAAGFDESMKNQAPYNEMLWRGGNQDCFYCYSRDQGYDPVKGVLRKTAREVGLFLKDMNIRVAYMHLPDTDMKGGWCRCSMCKSRWPNDQDYVQFAQAQANAANVYLEELKKVIPDFKMNLVPTLYALNNYPPVEFEKYQKEMNKKLHPDVALVFREGSSSWVDDIRSWHGTRPIYWYNQDFAYHRLVIDLQSTKAKTYYNGNQKDFYFGKNHGGSRKLQYAAYAYYAWNINAPGNMQHGLQVYNAVEDLKNPSYPARKALDAIAVRSFGSKWGPLAVKSSLTWLVPGVFGGSCAYNQYNVHEYFPPVKAASSNIKRFTFIDMQLQEAKRMEAIVNPIFSQPDVPNGAHEWTLYDVYINIMLCRIMGEPLYWEEKAKLASTSAERTDAQKQGFRATQQMMDKTAYIYGNIVWDCNAREGYLSVLTKLENYLKGVFANGAGVKDYFLRCADVVHLVDDFVAKGNGLNYRADFKATSGSASLKYLKKPAWVNATSGGLLTGLPTRNGIDTVTIQLNVNGQPKDTMDLYIHTTPDFNNWDSTATGIYMGYQQHVASGFGLRAIHAGNAGVDFQILLDRAGMFDLTVYNIIGQQIWKYQKALANAGIHRIRWSAHDKYKGLLSHATVLFVRLGQGNRQAVRRLVWVR